MHRMMKMSVTGLGAAKPAAVKGFSKTRVGFGIAAMVMACLLPTAWAQTKLGPAAPITYDNKYEIYGGLNYMNFKAGENLPKRMNLGGAEVSGTWWLRPNLGLTADYRGGAGTTQVYPNAQIYGIHRPLVYMNMGLFGVQYRGPRNQHAAINYHAYGGVADGIFDAGTQGAGPTPGVSATSNANIVGLYANHAAALVALGGSLDFNQSKNWALRLSPDLILNTRQRGA